MTLETASGMLVPAARKVIPITESGIFSVCPGTPNNHKMMADKASKKRTYDSNHPSHDVGQGADPDNAHDEGEREPLLEARLLAVGDGEHEDEVDGPREHPRDLREAASTGRPSPQAVHVLVLDRLLELAAFRHRDLERAVQVRRRRWGCAWLPYRLDFRVSGAVLLLLVRLDLQRQLHFSYLWEQTLDSARLPHDPHRIKHDVRFYKFILGFTTEFCCIKELRMVTYISSKGEVLLSFKLLIPK